MYATFDIAPSFRGTCARREHDGNNLYNTYYQWVAIYLVVEALIFYLPRAIWLSLEGGLMKYLARGTRGKVVENALEKQENLLKTFQEHLHNKYNLYAFGFICCEVGNFFVLLSQIFLTNLFLNYTFLKYGIQVLSLLLLPLLLFSMLSSTCPGVEVL